MLDPDQLTLLQERLSATNQTVVVLSPSLSADGVVGALSLALVLKQAGKPVQVVSTTPSNLKLPGVELIQPSLGNKDLQVSFPYDETKVDKVSYSIDEEGKFFNLLIQPKTGVSPLDPSQVQFSLVGAQADLIFVFGATTLSDLDGLYVGFESVYESACVVSVHTFNPGYATLAIDVSHHTSYCESLYVLMQQLGLSLTPEAATNLLAGLDGKTNHLQSLNVTADTLDTAAALLRQGARRSRQNLLVTPTVNPAPASATQTSVTASSPKSFSPSNQPASQGGSMSQHHTTSTTAKDQPTPPATDKKMPKGPLRPSLSFESR